ncbi:hypothetical protein BU26DRAFT_512028 [Trematosphaeria pertusa]|uniref:Extracellular membrane protein CFEM domain-containing protein n=1 Tax=Trematosphaeria pertusa TaxID=390896 RepID=A0A6A6HSZ8_9PLEO|nr:uncharacterized protein BU26DRAFT_512028 [Trematosphaeria pertusa]KAF2240898.1 hypothetical protein BU26DRAFT_512028 [Trematosphaeria pertusa]
MFSKQFGALLLAFGGVVGAIQFNGPAPTPINKRWDANGWTPIPTSKPKPILELFRRQSDPAFCGYLEGDPEEPVSCDLGYSCMYDDVYSWFGCCTGSYITDCDVYTACVEYRSIDDCMESSECWDDPLATACPDPERPYCATLYTLVSGEPYGHFACAATDTAVEVVSTTVDGDSSFLFPTETEDFFTVSPTFTFSPEETSTEDETSTEEETSTEAESSTRRGSTRTPLTDDSTQAPSSTAPAETGQNAPSSVSTGAAMRTAEAVFGAAGGLVGILALVL